MLKPICSFLEKNPKSKAKAIAGHLGADKTEVNRVLHANLDKFAKNDDYEWSLLTPGELRFVFEGDSWLVARDFEEIIGQSLCPLSSACPRIVFVLRDESKLLLEALARLLALCNQLAGGGKEVTLDLTGARSTDGYLNRLGFYDLLVAPVEVLPMRPKSNLAKAYRGNNDAVIELRAIDPGAPDQEIPRLLQQSFVSCAGDSYSTAAFTFLSELFGNVVEHSGIAAAGFAGLQFYGGGKRHIQAVISDNGLGIAGTLAPIISSRYPQVAKRISASKLHPGVALLKEVFSFGGISQVDEEGRGLGLRRSGQLAEKFRARISVRQSDFEFRIIQAREKVSYEHTVDLARIDGTHICFDFMLDGPRKSR
jgi:hypothetical protein